MTDAEKLAEIARIGNYLRSPDDPAATRDSRNAGGVCWREADPQQAGSVCVPAPGRRASGARPGASYFHLVGLAIIGASAGGMIAALALVLRWVW